MSAPTRWDKMRRNPVIHGASRRAFANRGMVEAPDPFNEVRRWADRVERAIDVQWMTWHNADSSLVMEWTRKRAAS